MDCPLVDVQKLSFTIILHAGNARSFAMEAIRLAKKFDFPATRDKIEDASTEIVLAHKEQTKLLQKDVAGEKSEFSIMLIHAQDHLMTALTVKDLANEMIDMYEKMHQLEEGQ